MTEERKKRIKKDGSISRLIIRYAMPNIINIGPHTDILDESHSLGMISIANMLSATYMLRPKKQLNIRM